MSNTWLVLGIIGGIFLTIFFCSELDACVSRHAQKRHDLHMELERTHKEEELQRQEAGYLNNTTEKQATQYQDVNTPHNGSMV